MLFLDQTKSITVGGYYLPIQSGLISTFGWVEFMPVDAYVISDYISRGVARLIEQFKRKPNIEKYLEVFLEEIQEVEYVMNDMLVLRQLQNAAGVNLDGLGEIVGLTRDGRSDSAYRNEIIFQAAFNFNCGQPDFVIDFIKHVTSSSNVVYNEMYPATVYMQITSAILNIQLANNIKDIMPAGVQLEITTSYEELNVFQFLDDDGSSNPATYGFFEPTYAPDALSGGSLTEKFL